MAAAIVIPESFADMMRWSSEGTQWLDGLPGLVNDQCDRWDLRICGQAAHGSNAIVFPVSGGTDKFALRLTRPGPEVADEIRALMFWDGHGTVRLFDADARRGATLLEWLSSRESLNDVPVSEAMAHLGRMMRHLAVPGADFAPATGAVAASRAEGLEREWDLLGQPFDPAVIAEAMHVSQSLSAAGSNLAVNGDLHSENVLRAEREDWLTVDPRLLHGDIEYDLGNVLWTRLDEMPSAADIVRCFDIVVTEAKLERDRARNWAVFRAVDYWLWGLSHGLTEDPPRCARLFAALMT